MRKSCLVAVATAAVAATPALAQESAVGRGFRVEALVGYDRIGVDSVAADGLVYGIGLGYDVRIGGVIAGLEGEASGSATDECAQTVGPHDPWRCVTGGRDLYAGARLGVAMGRNTVLYAKLGYANGHVDPEPVFVIQIFPPPDFSRNLDGVRAGAGLEIGLGGRVFVKAEYRYTNYEDGFHRNQLMGGLGLRF